MTELATYHALSVKQPWANLIAARLKTVETRTWETRYRGELLIVSSARPPIFPSGCAVALATLADCRPMQVQDQGPAYCPPYPGAWAWVLQNVRPVRPVPLRGHLGVYSVTIPPVECVSLVSFHGWLYDHKVLLPERKMPRLQIYFHPPPIATNRSPFGAPTHSP